MGGVILLVLGLLVEVDVFVCLFLGEVGGQAGGIADAREKQGEHLLFLCNGIKFLIFFFFFWPKHFFVLFLCAVVQ